MGKLRANARGRLGSLSGSVAFALALVCSLPEAYAQNGRLPSLPGTIRTDEVLDVNQALKAIEKDPAIRALIKRDRANALRIEGAASGSGVETFKFKHYYKNLEVVGSQAFLHNTAQGREVQDSVVRFDLDVTPSISSDQAIALAKSYSGDAQVLEKPELKILSSRSEGKARLIHSVKLQGSLLQGNLEVQIDAHTGKLVAEIPDHIHIAPIQVYTAEKQGIAIAPRMGRDPQDPTKVTLAGCAVFDLATEKTSRVDAETCLKLKNDACQTLKLNGEPMSAVLPNCKQVAKDSSILPGADAPSKRALDNALRVRDYYFQTHSRNSYDNMGGEIANVVHIGVKYANAFWSQNGHYMAYGEGDGEETGDFTQGLDVAGHEMTHGVVEKTARLGRNGEPAALNEAYADFFGKMIENKGDWLLGTQLYVHPEATKAIRNLETPGSLRSVYFDRNDSPKEAPYPSKVSEMGPIADACVGKNDFCNAHYNATIPGHAAYLIYTAIGKEKTEKLYYLTLTQFLTETSSFRESAESTLKACGKLYDAATCDEVKSAFTSVGML